MITYFLRDHKVGFKLAKKSSKVINKHLPDIKLITFYKFYYDKIKNDTTNKYVIFIRNPKEVIVSGYLYHKVCKEHWTKDPGVYFYDEYLDIIPTKYKNLIGKTKKFTTNKSYQQVLKELSQEEGLKFELKNVGDLTLSGLNDILDLNQPNVHFIDMNDYQFKFEKTFKRLFKFLELDKNYFEQLKARLEIKTLLTNVNNFNKSIKHITNKDLDPNRYKKYWFDELDTLINNKYPNLMKKYEDKIL